VFLSSHVLSEVQRLADAVVVIRSGRVVATGSVEELRRSARQPFSVWFEGEPPFAAIAAVAGVGELEMRGTEVSGVLEGSPSTLMAVLGRHTVTHVLFPEPDLEDAFLRYYEVDRP
jgi:ABC-2 type transport system ATP-binding protein